MKPNLSTPESREFWRFVDRVCAEVKRWPWWMKGRTPRPPLQPTRRKSKSKGE